MLAKSKITEVRSLADKKVRLASGCFVAEGAKLTGDLVAAGMDLVACYGVGLERCLEIEGWLRRRPISLAFQVLPELQRPSIFPEFDLPVRAPVITEVSSAEMARLSQLKTPTDVLGVFAIPHAVLDETRLKDSLSIVLDGVQDPGNLGTIIRIADWFGIREVICSPSSADCYNPKVVQATMGAIARVRVHYVDLLEFLERVTHPGSEDLLPRHARKGQPLTAQFREEQIGAKIQKEPLSLPVYGTFLAGSNLYTMPLTATGFLVFGSEGHGISPEVERFVSHRVYIPPFPGGASTSESLNVAVATAITCAEFRRRTEACRCEKIVEGFQKGPEK